MDKELYNQASALLKDRKDLLVRFEILCKAKARNKDEELFLLAKAKETSPRRTYKKLKKLIKKLEYEVDTEKPQPGPAASKVDIEVLKKKLNEFIYSPYFKKDPSLKKDKIRFYLMGSLITGFASQKSKYAGEPSDKGRISDIDLGIIIDREFFDSFIHTAFDVVHGTKRSVPMDMASKELGPFRYLFAALKGLKMAGKTNRKLSIVFIEKSFFLALKLRDEPHIKVLELWI
ncbi:hypothetical protein GOV06_02040 [Candidatus Woesearchaeota archaeon]|nr:hypothetical protein [Candidatus Woesearchaeota archaeon]